MEYTKGSEKNVFIGITADKQVFFTINKILNEQKEYTLEKVVYPWQITTDKNYFKKIKFNNKQPDIRGLCAEWQYKYLFNKPLSLWERTKLQLLTKRYLVPTSQWHLLLLRKNRLNPLQKKFNAAVIIARQ